MTPPATSHTKTREIESSSPHQRLHRFFDHPAVFNAYQLLVDGGKGRQIRRFLLDVPVSSVLDIGCGTGNWAGAETESYLGVDISERFVEAARKRYAGESNKQFLQLNPVLEDVPGHYDLAQLISVLHHLSDEHAGRLLQRIVPKVRYVFVLDLYPIPWNPIARWLYQADRGDFIRSPEQQKRLIERSSNLKLIKEDDYFAPTGVYRHTLLLYESRISPYSASPPQSR